MTEISSTGKFDPRLSSYRGLCSVWVLLYHESVFLGFPLAGLFFVFDSGWVAVPIFFMLSIFLLMKSLDTGASVKDYFVRRIKRIWPLYFLTVFLVYILYLHDTVGFAYNITFVADFLPWASHQYVFWSLQVEEVAYLFFPLIHRMSRQGQRDLAWVMILTASVYLIIVLWLQGLYTSSPDLSLIAWLMHLPFLALAAYGVGLLAYVGDIPDLGHMTVPLAALAVFATTIYNADEWVIVLPFLLAPLMVRPAEFLRYPVLVFLGEISYSLYLIHLLLIWEVGIWSLPLSILAATAMELSVRYGQVTRRMRLALSSYRPKLPTTPT